MPEQSETEKEMNETQQSPADGGGGKAQADVTPSASPPQPPQPPQTEASTMPGIGAGSRKGKRRSGYQKTVDDIAKLKKKEKWHREKADKGRGEIAKKEKIVQLHEEKADEAKNKKEALVRQLKEAAGLFQDTL